ncbi:MAG: hypothetical protein JW951_03970 [Lentisphaerae bacterium]|nr:hypothetical protein [Lentisphaerota bacterium]
MAGNTRDSAALGLQFGADSVVNGTAVAKPAARRIAGSNLRSYEAATVITIAKALTL